LDGYFRKLESITVSIFGSRRQEGAGNIFQLLSMGVKVFLRRENNMLYYLRDKGFIVFCFEDQFNSFMDLEQLPIAAQEHNRSLILQLFDSEKEVSIMHHLLES
jgi:hypothetical protein